MKVKGSRLWMPLSRQDVAQLIQFYDPAKNRDLNELQTEGCYRIWNTLCDDSLRFAYLADEVGMGKTYQALGVVGLLHYLKPDARIVILCPGKEMQKQWSSDWHSFFKDKFCPDGIDGHLKSCRIEANGTPGFESSVQPLVCENLNQFAASLVASQHSAYLLRYPSFSLPIRVFDWDVFRGDRSAKASFDSLVADFRKCMEAIGYPVNDDELEAAREGTGSRLTLDEASSLFMGLYARSIAQLINVFSPDLVIWDEAQYLRTDATRNDSMRTIFGRLHQAGCRHLFLSATPAHRDVRDINQLNHLLGDAQQARGSLIHVRQEDGQPDAFRQSVSRWMVRRERTFASVGKQQYRDFVEVPVDLFGADQSPLYALTFAAMQKNLVALLDGCNNRFRMGEISCNESARASIESALPHKESATEEGSERDGYSVLEESSSRSRTDPIDESYLQGLGERFKMLQSIAEREIARELPHAKVDHVVSDLARVCLDNGAGTKELVFVRRVATVDELADGLLREFQHILNDRIRALGEYPEDYWGLSPDEDDNSDDSDDGEPGESAESFGPVGELPYFKALSAAKGSLGRLTKYRSFLGTDTSTIRFLFVAGPDMTEEDVTLWNAFLRALGISVNDEIYQPFREDSNKELLLRRCMGHSLRFTDILVDLDVLRRRHRKGYVEKWLEMLANPPPALAGYFTNTRAKLRGWIEHFEKIVNKCFKGSSPHNSYQDIAERVASYFRGLSPVARRSGRRTDENVVVQFKFPVYPNVLICTDVLREGVNLHLFCERVSHYGVAWNSGDLEQRIGRVERADSLFERQILKNGMHKLHVGFPYLAKTLDERQVRKAIRKKREIDALFSIVPPRETGECDDSREKAFDGISARHAIDPLLPEMREWPSVGGGWSKDNHDDLEKWSASLRHAHALVSGMSSLDLQGFRFSCCRMLGELGLLVIEWDRLSGSSAVPRWNACDRLVLAAFERKTQWKAVRSLYFPMQQTLTREIVEEFWANAEAGISGTQADSLHEGFSYCGERNSHIREHRIKHPAERDQLRTQVSYRCRWGSGFALASFVGSSEGEDGTFQSADRFVSDINKNLPFGCATIHDDRLMLVFPQALGGAWEPAINSRVAHILAHWADRHQWVLMRGEDEDGSFHSLPISGLSEMNTSEAIDVLGAVRKWCEELNMAIEGESGYSTSWRLSTFDRMVKTGSISSASEIVSISGSGKFQIAYSVTGLDGKAEDKKVVIYLSAKPANVRVVSNDMDDIWEFLCRNGSYETWLGSDYHTEISGHDFHYAYAEHRDGKQFRRLRLMLTAADLESYGDRDIWISHIVRLASVQLLNDVFQYNAAKAKMDGYRKNVGFNVP